MTDDSIDITPTWSGLVLGMLEAYPHQRTTVLRDEFVRMAKLADLYVDSVKVQTCTNGDFDTPTEWVIIRRAHNKSIAWGGKREDLEWDECYNDEGELSDAYRIEVMDSEEHFEQVYYRDGDQHRADMEG